MSFKSLGAGSTITGDVREALEGVTLPDEPHFVVRASHSGPLALTTLALNTSLLILEPVRTTNGWITVPIERPLSVGDRLGWTVFAGFSVPRLAAYLVIHGEVRFLSRKEGLNAGGLWASRVTLRSFHLE